MTNKHFKKFLTPLVNMETQMKAIIKYFPIPTGMAKIFKIEVRIWNSCMLPLGL